MKCPDCNIKTKVVSSRVVGDRVVRYRVCPNCRRACYTSEEEINYNRGLRYMNQWEREYKGRANDGLLCRGE